MDVVDFTTYLIKNIVKNPDMVKVSSFMGEEETTMVEVLVSNEDMGAVIGKSGKNALAVRTIIQANAYLININKILIEIVSC